MASIDEGKDQAESLAVPTGALVSKPSGRFVPPEQQIYANAVSMSVTNVDLTINLGRNALEVTQDGGSSGYAVGIVGVSMSPEFAKVLRGQLDLAIALQENIRASAIAPK